MSLWTSDLRATPAAAGPAPAACPECGRAATSAGSMTFGTGTGLNGRAIVPPARRRFGVAARKGQDPRRVAGVRTLPPGTAVAAERTPRPAVPWFRAGELTGAWGIRAGRLGRR